MALRQEQQDPVTPSRRRITGLILMAMIVLGSLLVSSGVGSAYSCSGDYIADGTDWRDNQWFGDECSDKVGEMVRAIQVIVAESYPYCDPGDDDGWWGPNTKSGVICFQDYKGLTPDGIVGPNTWGQRATTPHTGLISELTGSGSGGGIYWFRTDWADDRFYFVVSTQYWYLFKYSCYDEYTLLHAGGPTYGGCT